MTMRILVATVTIAASLAVSAQAAPNMGFPMGGPYAKGFDDFVVVPPPPRPCRPVQGVGRSGKETVYPDGTIVGDGYICEGDPTGSPWPSIDRVPNQ